MKKTTPRQDAKQKGDKLYIGRRCIRGHSGIRYVSNGCCIECLAISNERAA